MSGAGGTGGAGERHTSAPLINQVTVLANRRRHILVVVPAGWRELRIHAEVTIVRRGWILAQNPAGADGLLVLGDSAPKMVELIERLWGQLPGPRARAAASATRHLDTALDLMVEQWTDVDTQRRDAAARVWVDAGSTVDMPIEHGMQMGHDPATEPVSDVPADHGMGQDHEPADANGMDQHMDADVNADSGVNVNVNHGMPTDPDSASDTSADTTTDHGTHADADHGMDMDDAQDENMDHGKDMDMGMDHGMHMDMTGPGGIPLAGGSELDRDGLEMDVLSVALGPVLPWWPDGLVVRGTLSGDVLSAVTTEIIGGPGGASEVSPVGPATGRGVAGGSPELGERKASAIHLLDDVGRMLQLAGWVTLGDRALRVRDKVAAGADPSDVDVTGLVRATKRSRVLRWSLARSGSRRLRESVDLVAILDGWMAILNELAGGNPAQPSATPRLSVEDLPTLLEGMELSDVRLVVAALSLDAQLNGHTALAPGGVA